MTARVRAVICLAGCFWSLVPLPPATATFTITGNGVGSAAARGLPPAPLPNGTISSPYVNLSWTRVRLFQPDGPMITLYLVDARYMGSNRLANDSCAPMQSGTSCRDQPPGLTQLQYRLRARFQKWNSSTDGPYKSVP